MEFTKDGRIMVEPPKRPKKLTATRFATILGLNAWASPFSAWCEMTRTYEDPFVENKYTKAGKVIEPKICDYLRERYFMDIKSPTDVYGEDYFKKTWGDFFPEYNGLGGMWDFLGDDFVVEVKTTKRVEDWRGADGKVEPPIYYKLQASLYAYLLGFDDVVMTCSFLEDKDYDEPEKFTPSVDNTVVVEFKVSEEFPTFVDSYIKPAMAFWNDNVLTGISPVYDEKKDEKILKVLRKNVIGPEDKEVAKLVKEADKLKAQVDRAEAKIKEKKDRLKEIDDLVKKRMIQDFRDGDKNVEMKGTGYIWNVRRDKGTKFDKKRFENEHPGMLTDYETETTKYVLTKTAIEEDK